ncbi:MAG TPA: heparin lyase I family protein [Pararhizobium sp.]|uniref:heparin lyase I family protein n=1 Tax=Pararhizobium sp. TaxID=1977563 RepID=UPI002CD0D7A6|nr:heparin lyase I family protein [Pararhizobium sp.]HTO33041.1 heparin lyase I family protein [Pararhizobium sp.]
MSIRQIHSCALMLSLAATPLAAQTLSDDFDAGSLGSGKWSTQQILSRQMTFEKAGRCEATAMVIRTTEEDGGIECDDDCQRAELRTIKSSWPIFGDEVWYAFSFRVEGNVPPIGSTRFVISQWKGPGDSSPMLAQRFDNGVFHITVQDNETRRVVAQAEGDYEAVLSAQNLLGKLDPNDGETVDAVKALQSIDQLIKSQPELSKELFDQTLLKGLEAEKPTSDTKEISKALGLKNSELVSQFSAFSFVANPEKYLGEAEIDIIPEGNRKLPDPRKGWVDMVYRIKPGRLDNEYGPRQKGEIDIWANGDKIVSVRGNIGAKLRADLPLELRGPYFKFGTYRLRIPGTFDFKFDEFSQAPTRDELVVACDPQ